jgi:hypothetical protein
MPTVPQRSFHGSPLHAPSLVVKFQRSNATCPSAHPGPLPPSAAPPPDPEAAANAGAAAAAAAVAAAVAAAAAAEAAEAAAAAAAATAWGPTGQSSGCAGAVTWEDFPAQDMAAWGFRGDDQERI